jgi:hypothetical protein
MVQEYRRIVLSTDELASALEIYRRIAPDFLPEGEVVRCVVTEYGVVKLTMEVKREGAPPNQSYLTLQAADILKPVIAFCLENKLPLPKTGRKFIEMQRGSVVLRIELNIEVAVPVTYSDDTVKAVTRIAAASK